METYSEKYTEINIKRTESTTSSVDVARNSQKYDLSRMEYMLCM